MTWINIAGWLLVTTAALGFTTYLVNRLFGASGGSVKTDFDRQLKRAQELEKEINALKKESTRATVDFQEALKKHRAKYGSGHRPDGPPDAS